MAPQHKRRRSSTEKVRKGNPFEIPENAYHLGVLRAVEPFLTIWEGDDPLAALKGKNKFFGGLMPHDTLQTVVRLLGDRFTVVESIYQKQRTEGNMRPWHLSLFDTFYLLSIPSTTELSELQRKLRIRHDTAGLQMLDNLDSTEDTDYQGFLLEISVQKLGGGEGPGVPASYERHLLLQEQQTNEQQLQQKQNEQQQSSLSGGPIREGFETRNEDAPTGELGVLDSGRTDIKLVTHKQSVLRNPRLQKRRRSSINTELCPCIAECKPKETDAAVYQDIGYGVIEVRNNIEHGHYDPIYLPIFAGNKFTYAVLDVHGMIRVSRNSISEVAYNKYKEYCSEKGVTPMTHEQLEALLGDGMEELELWKDCCVKEFPEKKYVVGDVYIKGQWHPLPTGEMGYSSPESLFFIEGMLRIVLGDQVLSWTPDDVRRAFNRRRNFIKLKSRCNGTPQDEDDELSGLTNAQLRTRLRRVYLEMKKRADAEELFKMNQQAVQGLRRLDSDEALKLHLCLQPGDLDAF